LDGTRLRRTRGQTHRGMLFLLAALVVPVGLDGVLAQDTPGGWVLAAIGLACLAGWWVMRPRYAGVLAASAGALCSSLTILVTATAEFGLVVFLASPASGVTAATRRSAAVAAVAALVLLAGRLLASYWLRAVLAGLAGPAGPAAAWNVIAATLSWFRSHGVLVGAVLAGLGVLAAIGLVTAIIAVSVT
jgi:hypothetical protein